MSNSEFKMIGKLGLLVWDQDGATGWVKAEELETILQSAQVVYGGETNSGLMGWNEQPSKSDTDKALLIGIEPIKKKTKAEAALEFVEKFKSGMLSHVGYLEAEKEAIRILEMKDDE